MRSRSPATAWRQFFNITPNPSLKAVYPTRHYELCRIRALGAHGKSKDDPAKYHLSIAEVAQRCGYQDSDYFCRLFHREFGLTPGEYGARFKA